MKTTIEFQRAVEGVISQERAQARFVALRDAWQICKKSNDGKQIALQIWEEMESAAEVLRGQRRDVQKELLCQMLQIPSVPENPIETAYEDWSETTNANEFSELPTRRLNVPTAKETEALIKDLNSGADESLAPFVKKVISAIQSMASADLNKLAEPLAAFVPHGKTKKEFAAEISDKLGIPVELDSTLGDVARKIRSKES